MRSGGLNYRRGPTHVGRGGIDLQRDNEIPRAHPRSYLARRFGARTPAALVAALVFVTLTISLVLVVASLPWWDLHIGSPWNQLNDIISGACVSRGLAR